MLDSSLRFFLRQLIIFCCFLCIAIPSEAQHIGFYFERERNHVTLPIEVYNNLIVVSALVNEKYPLNFILDTGVRPSIFFNKKFVDTLGMDYQRSVQLFGVGNDDPIEALVAKPVSISLPGIKSTEISALVLYQDILQLERYLGIRIHGIIGYDLFSRFVVKINYAKKKIKLYEPTAFRPRKKDFPIPIEIIDGKPITSIFIQLSAADSIHAKLLVDTGASHALVLHQNSSSGFELPDKCIETNLGRGLAGEINGCLGRIDGINFGKSRLTGVITSFPRKPIATMEGRSLRNGSIGGELLKKFTVIFDFIHARMYVKPNAAFKHPFEYNMSGLEFTAEGIRLNRFVINEIRINSAASKAGFKPGDVMVSLNNIPSKKLDLTKIYTNLNLKEGKKITMTVYRDGKYISRSFRLKREI